MSTGNTGDQSGIGKKGTVGFQGKPKFTKEQKKRMAFFSALGTKDPLEFKFQPVTKHQGSRPAKTKSTDRAKSKNARAARKVNR